MRHPARSLPPLAIGLAISMIVSAATSQKPSASAIKRAQKAIIAFLEQPGIDRSAATGEGKRRQKEAAALKKAAKACGNLKVAVAALRALPPLSKAKPGTYHGVKFESGGTSFAYSIRLPKGYDNKKRFPVLVLPDHGAVGAEAGIAFWEQDRKLVEQFILFRPVICKFQTDKTRFPEQQFFKRDAAIAGVMKHALTHLRLHYAVDHDRFVLTGLSQAGYYSYYYAVSFPDEFAGIVPESAGGMAVRLAIRPLARNLKSMQVKILHAKADQITPFSDAQMMHDAIKQAGGKVEFVQFTTADYRRPNPRQHPTPHDRRISNVLPFALQCNRVIARDVDRVVRYPQQLIEGRFKVTPPQSLREVFVLKASDSNRVLSSSHKGTTYLVPPDDVLARRRFKVGGRWVTPKADLELLLYSYLRCPDPQRLVAARIEIK